MGRIFFYMFFIMALFAEILAIGFTGSWHISFVRIGFVGSLVCNQFGLMRALFGLLTVLVSAFFQGNSLVALFLYYGGSALLWQPFEPIVSRTYFAYSFMGIIFMVGATLVDQSLFWTPFSAVTTILSVPFLIQLMCKV